MSLGIRRWIADDDVVLGDRPRRSSDLLDAPLAESDPCTLGLLAGLQCIGRAAVALDCACRIVGMNELVRPLTGQLITTGEGRLAGRSHDVDERVRRLVRRAAGLDGRPRGDLAMLAASDDFALIMRALPLSCGGEPTLFRRARVLVLFALARGGVQPDGTSLREAFGLTGAEVEVALALARGADLRMIADERSISVATVRTQLKTIFAKTGTRRQATLVALILQLAEVAPSR